jgi:hypothetical protein
VLAAYGKVKMFQFAEKSFGVRDEALYLTSVEKVNYLYS